MVCSKYIFFIIKFRWLLTFTFWTILLIAPTLAQNGDGERSYISLVSVMMSETKERERIYAVIELQQRYPKESVPDMIIALENELKKNRQQIQDNLVRQLVIALGKSKDKKAFLPLVKVGQSSVSDLTKQQAQKSLELLDY